MIDSYVYLASISIDENGWENDSRLLGLGIWLFGCNKKFYVKSLNNFVTIFILFTIIESGNADKIMFRME